MEFIRTHRRLLSGLAFLALFLAGLAMVAAYTGWAEVAAALARVSPGQVAALLGLSLGNYLLRAVRWHIFARALGLQLGPGRDLLIYIGGFALTLTPGRLGELVRLRWVQRARGGSALRGAPLLLADRAADLAGVALVLLVAAGLGLGGAGGVYPVVAVALFLAWLATNPRLLVALVTLGWRGLGRGARLFAGLRRGLRQLARFARPQVALPALALSALGWLCEAYAFYLLLGWLGVGLGFWLATGIFLFAMLGGGATGLPGGLGGAEAVMVALLGLQGVPLEAALPATLIIRATTLWFAILLGLVIFPLAERGGPAHGMEN